MHEGALDAIGQQAALDGFRASIAKCWPSAVEIDKKVLASRFPRRISSLIAGWRLPGAKINSPCDLLLLLGDLFPNALPIVALADVPMPAKFPHVESDGTICLTSVGTLMELPVDIRHAEYLVDDAVKSMTASFAGSNRDEFLDECSTYWTLGQPSVNPLWYLPTNLGRTGTLHAVLLKEFTIVSESWDALSAWLQNLFPHATKRSDITGCAIHLPVPIFPDIYPKHTGEVMALVQRAGPEAVKLMADTLMPGEPMPMIFTFDHRGEKQLLGLTIDTGNQIGTGYGKGTFWNGYRKGHMPQDEFIRRVAAAKFSVARTSTVRVDSNFLLNRTAGPAAAALDNVRVAVIGCGALGGQVGQLLAQAGVRRLTLVDNDVFQWQNVGRHVLSGRAVRQNKALALKGEILSKFPDYEVEAINEKWQDAWKESPQLFDKHDLVVSLTADWPSDALLNRLSKQDLDLPAVIFSWLEAYGLAGHVVTVLPEGGCLRCLTDQAGEFIHAVAVVPPKFALQRESSCGSFYQPFSAVSIAPVAAQVVKSAIAALTGRMGASEHRVWVGSKEDFDAVEATLKPEWQEPLTANGYDRMYNGLLLRAANCPVCQSNT